MRMHCEGNFRSLLKDTIASAKNHYCLRRRIRLLPHMNNLKTEKALPGLDF